MFPVFFLTVLPSFILMTKSSISSRNKVSFPIFLIAFNPPYAVVLDAKQQDSELISVVGSSTYLIFSTELNPAFPFLYFESEHWIYASECLHIPPPQLPAVKHTRGNLFGVVVN